MDAAAADDLCGSPTIVKQLGNPGTVIRGDGLDMVEGDWYTSKYEIG